MYLNGRKAILRSAIFIRAFMSDSEKEENKQKANKECNKHCSSNFLHYLQKTFGHFLSYFGQISEKNFGHFAELEGKTNRILPTKISDTVRKLGRFL